MGNKAEKEIKPYEQDKLAKVPSWLKILLLKYWAAGAAYYFFAVGGAFLWNNNDQYDIGRLMVIMILGIALFNNLIVRPIVRYMRNSRDNTYYYNVVNNKGALSFFLNLGYAIIIMLPLERITDFLGNHNLLFDVFGVGNDALDPFMFALIYVILDFIALFIKNSSIAIYRKIKYKD